MTWRFKIVLFRTAGRSRRWFGDLINLTQGHALALLMHDIQMPTGITRTSKSLPFQIFLVIFIRLLLVHFVFLVFYFVYFINTEKKNTKKNKYFKFGQTVTHLRIRICVLFVERNYRGKTFSWICAVTEFSICRPYFPPICILIRMNIFPPGMTSTKAFSIIKCSTSSYWLSRTKLSKQLLRWPRNLNISINRKKV